MSTQNSFDLLSVSHELVLKNDLDILQVLSVQQGGDVIRIGYSTEDKPQERLTTTTTNFRRANPSIQIYATQKGVYRRHLIISNNLAKSLTLTPPAKKDYITIDLDFKQPLISSEDYRLLLINLNSWRYRESIIKKALTISPQVYDLVNAFISGFYQYFNVKYSREIIVNIAKEFQSAHNNISENTLLESMNYLKFYERKLSLLQVDKIHQCLIFILKNWVLCEYDFTNKSLVHVSIKVLNGMQKTPRLGYDVGFSTLSHYLRQYN